MRSLGFWGLFLLAGAVLVVLSLSGGRGSDSVFTSDGTVTASYQGHVPLGKLNRKLKAVKYNGKTTGSKTKSSSFNVEDYPHFDPTPSSKATIKNGPIEHGTPLMPYIPQPTPPSHPNPICGSP